MRKNSCKNFCLAHFVHQLVYTRICLGLSPNIKNSSYLRWFGMLKCLTGGYFATSICIFPQFCILLFPNNTKINWIC